MPPLDLGSLLQQYLSVSPGQTADNAADHFHEVAQTASPEILSHGIAEAFRSDQTPPFGQMEAQLFAQATPEQKAAMLNQLLTGIAPGALASVGVEALAGLAGQTSGGQGQVLPQQATAVSPDQVRQLATHAEQQSPDIIDKLSGFYAEHPGLVKTLGGAALTIALAKIANRMNG